MVEGGSTLTQQTVKMLIHRDRTAAGKLREAVLALRLEHRLSKREILALYLSIAPYGSQVQGAEAASRAYFDTSAENLTAGPGRAPGRAAAAADARSIPTGTSRRRGGGSSGCSSGCATLGLLSAEDYETARQETPADRAHRARLPGPAFRGARAGLGARPARRGASRRRSTPTLQREVAGIVDRHRARLIGHGAHNVAVAVLDNRTSEWRAWEGSGDYLDQDHGGAIDGVITPRQPGSALKPFTYALAFEQGYTPASVLPDLPTHFPDRRRRRPLQPAELRRRLPRALAGAGRPRRIGERARGLAPVPDRSARPPARAAPRRPHHAGQDARLLRLRAHHGRRRGAPRRARGRPTRPSRAEGCGVGPRRADASCATERARAGRPVPVPPACRRRRAGPLAARRLLAGRRPLRRRRARVHLRLRGQPGLPVPGGGEDGHVAGVPRQLDDRLHARRHRRRLGRQLRSHAAAQLVRGDGCGPDLPRRDDGRAARIGGRLPAGGRAARRAPVRPRAARRSARSPGATRPELLPAPGDGVDPHRPSGGPCRWHRRRSDRVVVAWPPIYRAWARQQGLLRFGRARRAAPPEHRLRHEPFAVTRGDARARNGCAS